MDTTGTTMVMPSAGAFGMGGDLGALLIGALLFGGGFGGWGRGVAGAAGAELAINPQIQSINDRLSTMTNQMNTSALADSIGDLAVAANSNNLALNQAVDNNARAILQNEGTTQTAIANANFSTLTSLNNTLAAITAQNNQNQLNTLDRFNNQNISILTGFNTQNGLINAGFNQLIMGQNNLASQMAACCCDMKQTIAASGAKTDALINSIYVQNLQGQLADTKAQLSNCNQSNYIANLFQTYLNPIPCPCRQA